MNNTFSQPTGDQLRPECHARHAREPPDERRGREQSENSLSMLITNRYGTCLPVPFQACRPCEGSSWRRRDPCLSSEPVAPHQTLLDQSLPFLIRRKKERNEIRIRLRLDLNNYTFEGLKVFDAQTGSLQAQEFRFFDGVLLPLFLFLCLTQPFVPERLFELGESLLTLHILRNQVAVVVLQSHFSFRCLVQCVAAKANGSQLVLSRSQHLFLFFCCLFLGGGGGGVVVVVDTSGVAGRSRLATTS